MNTTNTTPVIQPNLLSLLDLLDVYLEQDEETHFQSVVEAALSADSDSVRRARLEQSSLDMVRQARLETAFVRQSILNSTEWLDHSVQAVSLFIDTPELDTETPVF